MINLIKKLIFGEKGEVKSKINLKKSSKNDTEYSSFSGNHIHGNVIVSGGGKVVINGKEIKQGKSLGPYISQNREVANFNKLDLSGVVNVTFKQSDEYSLVVQAEESVISQVITNVKNETLYISIDGNFFSTKSVNVTINAPEIVFVKQSGVTSFEAHNLKSEFLEFKFKSTGKATLSGLINSANFSIDGVGNFDAKKLVTNSLKVDASGVGTVYLHATESITGSLNGVGDRHIYGNPRIAGLKTGGVGTTKHH